MKKIVLSILTALLFTGINAQIDSLITNPDGGFGAIGKPIVYNGNLYYSYTNASGIDQLAKYNGSSVALVPNPDAGWVYNSVPMIVFNSNLYFRYENASSICQMAKYNGTSISLISNPDAGYGYMGYSIVYNSNLYFRYKNASNIFQLAKFDGTSITLFSNPDAGNGFYETPIEYNGNLYFSYQNASGKYQLAKFDGTTVSLISSPDAGNGLFISSMIVFNSNLYFSYWNASSKFQLAKYNGTTVSLISNPDAGSGFVGNPIVFNSNLFFSYVNESSKKQLAKFDGTSITLVSNPDAGNGFSGYPIVYNSNLYFQYTNASSKKQLAKFDGTVITLVTNPDAGTGFYNIIPIEYNGCIYFSYQNISDKYQLAKYDGSSISLIANPDAGSGFFFSSMIIYNSNLYFCYSNVASKYQLAKLKLAQTITFNSLSTKTYGNIDFTPGATSSSGLPVTYSSSNSTVATIVSNQIHIVSAGSCIIYADQVGNGTYIAAPQVSQTLTVNPSNLTITGVSANNKIYDGTTTAILSGGTLNGVIGSDVVTITAGTGTFSDKNVGNVKTVTATGYALGGTNANNYTLTAQPSGLTANITVSPLTISGVSANNKVYDGTASVSLSGGILNGIISPDVVTLNEGTGVFSDKNVGNDKIVTASGYTIGGTDASNYILSSQPSGLSADVTPAQLTVTADNKSRKVGEANPIFTVSYNGFKNGETEAVLTTLPVATCTADLSSPAGNYSITVTSGVATNYTFIVVSGTLSITLGIGIKNETNYDISIYPNPAHDYITINNPECEDNILHVQILNLSGVKLIDKNINDNVINIQSLQPGLYILKINNHLLNFIKD